MRRKVYLAIPCVDGVLHYLTTRGISLAEEDSLNFNFDLIVDTHMGISGDVSGTRNAIVSTFMNSDATDLIFADSDIGWETGDIAKLIEAPVDIVGGAYPVKTPDFTLKFLFIPIEHNNIQLVRDPTNNLIEAFYVPTGFMRIRREAIEKMIPNHSRNWYFDEIISDKKIYNIFEFGIDQETHRRGTEDFTFCRKWRSLGGKLWVHPDVTLTHVGKAMYSGGKLSDFL